MVIVNVIIPVVSLFITILQNIKPNGERLLPVKYRLLIADYGIFFLIAQLLVVTATFYFCRTRKYRVMAVIIFIAWIFIELLMPNGGALYD
jgi:hypothetical protein